MVVSAAGNLDHDQLVDAASKALSGVRAGPQPDRQPPGFTSARTLVKRPLDQVHQVLAFPAVGYHDKDIYAAYLTASILGGGMSSRLFQEARERRGLCYSTFAYVSAYADAGLMQIYAATAPTRLQSLPPLPQTSRTHLSSRSPPKNLSAPGRK
jgi:predicted Zn-dependent peptidase